MEEMGRPQGAIIEQVKEIFRLTDREVTVIQNLLKGWTYKEIAKELGVTVRTSMDGSGRFCLLTVSDNGPGISPENLPKVFEPRFSTKGMKGHGFGLASCFNIIQRHGGRLTVESEPGKGARFQASLPVLRGGKVA